MQRAQSLVDVTLVCICGFHPFQVKGWGSASLVLCARVLSEIKSLRHTSFTGLELDAPTVLCCSTGCSSVIGNVQDLATTAMRGMDPNAVITCSDGHATCLQHFVGLVPDARSGHAAELQYWQAVADVHTLDSSHGVRTLPPHMRTSLATSLVRWSASLRQDSVVDASRCPRVWVGVLHPRDDRLLLRPVCEHTECLHAVRPFQRREVGTWTGVQASISSAAGMTKTYTRGGTGTKPPTGFQAPRQHLSKSTSAQAQKQLRPLTRSCGVPSSTITTGVGTVGKRKSSNDQLNTRPTKTPRLAVKQAPYVADDEVDMGVYGGIECDAVTIAGVGLDETEPHVQVPVKALLERTGRVLALVSSGDGRDDDAQTLDPEAVSDAVTKVMTCVPDDVKVPSSVLSSVHADLRHPLQWVQVVAHGSGPSGHGNVLSKLWLCKHHADSTEFEQLRRREQVMATAVSQLAQWYWHDGHVSHAYGHACNTQLEREFRCGEAGVVLHVTAADGVDASGTVHTVRLRPSPMSVMESGATVVRISGESYVARCGVGRWMCELTSCSRCATCCRHPFPCTWTISSYANFTFEELRNGDEFARVERQLQESLPGATVISVTR
mgnify:FL=1